MEAALQIVGVLTVLFGAVSALVGLLVGPSPIVIAGAAFAFTWAGLFAGVGTLLLLLLKRGGVATAGASQALDALEATAPRDH